MEGGRSEIKRFYEDTNVFITGGTGFLGKLLIEKLLRVTWIANIFVLVRIKKNKNEEDRLQEIFDHEIFNSIKNDMPDFKKRIVLIRGDCVLPNLGISESDWDLLKANVNMIFHLAATVRFDQKIRTATYINVRGTVDIIKHAKQMKNLKAFIHVSTAYANCPRKDIDEVFYQPAISPSKMLNLLDCLTDEELEAITPSLIGQWPNTYSFTKCISEDVIRTESVGLPVAIVRPSIVISTHKEPLAGWFDNMYGLSGIIFGAVLGIIRTTVTIPKNLIDIVPADYVINIIIASAWKVSQKKTKNDTDIDIYNFVTSPEAPIRWEDCRKLSYINRKKFPFSKMIWFPMLLMNKNVWVYKIQRFFLHLLPAYTIDYLSAVFGKKPRMIDMYKKIHNAIDVFGYFPMREWSFLNNKTQELWKGLNEDDKKLFPFSMKNFDWDEYFKIYFLGARLYIMKDPLETLPYAHRRYFFFASLHYSLISVLLGCLLWFLYILLSYLSI